jgi:hypothetical protein
MTMCCTVRCFIPVLWVQFIHLAVCLTTGPRPLPNRALHIVRSIPPFTFPSITCCRRQFLCKMWPIQLASVYLFHVGYSSAPWLWVILHFSHDQSNWSSPSFSSTSFRKLSRCFWSTARSVQVSAPYKAMLQLLLVSSSILSPLC